MDDVDVAADVFSTRNESLVCERVLGPGRHGLDAMICSAG